MTDWILAATIVIYISASLALFLFGSNLIRFSSIVWQKPVSSGEPEPPIPDGELPTVTVQLPIYNELYVSRRIIKAVASLDYPRDRFQVQVLDDSTDETSAVIAHSVALAQAEGIDIVHIHRADRTGYKAGALANGLKTATGEFVAVFDADFVPSSDFLRRTVGKFDNPDVAFVQARWGHLNRDFSWLTKLQALAIDGHFLVEQTARGEKGYWFNFNGTCGVWRRTAIDDAGGWTADTLTEDLDLSYRAHLRGWRGAYIEDLVVPGEIPAQMNGFRRQQHRWARGSIECAARLLPQVWRSSASMSTKVQASLHLSAYGVHILLMLLALIYPLAVVAGARFNGFSTMFGLGWFFTAVAVAPATFFIAGQRRNGRNWLKELPKILMVTVLGSGLMVNTARAAWQIFTRPNPEFERTAKFGIEPETSDRNQWASKRYQLDIDRIVFAEFGLALYNVASAVLAWREGNWGILTYALVFATGLTVVCGTSVSHSLSIYRSRRHRAHTVEQERTAWNLTGQS